MVPFIERGNENGAEPGQQSDATDPGTSGIERMTPSAKQQKTEHSVTGDVAGLAEIEMKDHELAKIDGPEDGSEKVVKHGAGMFRGKHIGGFNADEDDPNQGWPPGAKQIRTS